jgi:hypothetical protein
MIESPEGQVSPLAISFMRPCRLADDTVEGVVRLECSHFDEVLTAIGSDDVQVFTLLISVGLSVLKTYAGDGFSIWWLEKGDLDYFDFWSYQKKPSEFCLPSAYHEAALTTFQQANEGKRLLPAHRVAIEPDRPAITTYAVQPDGGDVVDGLIGPDEIASLSPEELCRRLGHMLLIRTPEGRRLLGLSHLEPPQTAFP